VTLQVLTEASVKITAIGMWSRVVSLIMIIAPKMEAVCTSKTYVYSNETTWRYIPEDSNLPPIFASFVVALRFLKNLRRLFLTFMNLLFRHCQGFLDGQRPLARPLPIKDNTAQKDGTNIYALSGISTHEPSNEAVKTPIISLDRINEETSPVWFEVGTIFLNIIQTSKYYSDVLRLQSDKYVALSQHLLFLS
jgi:hypothetical protein